MAWWFKRNRDDASPEARAEARRTLRQDLSRAVVVDDAGDRRAAAAEARAALKRIVDEAVLLQGLAEDILDGVRLQRPLDELARPGGVLATRFTTLRAALPDGTDPTLRAHRDVVARVLDHHAMLLASSLDLLAVNWRSPRMVEQLERIDGLGAPAEWLLAVQAELAGDAAPDALPQRSGR
jgi:hypothetical protein